MRSVRLDNTARLCAAGGLVLLIVAQQKLCPWLHTAIEIQTPGTGRDAADEHGRKRVALPYVVPDVSAPRWSGAAQYSSVRQTVGSHDGVPRRGAQRPTTPAPDGAILDALHWPIMSLCPADDGERVVAAGAPLRLHPALRSTISTTGPPC
jgi:hypothetical protein